MVQLWPSSLTVYLQFLLFTTVYSTHRVALHRLRKVHAIHDSLSQPNPRTSTPNTTRTIHSRDATIISMREARVAAIIASRSPTSNTISTWLNTLNADGRWPDVDYTTGCTARRANWPAQEHWSRLKDLSAAWHGGLSSDNQHIKDDSTLTKILQGMKWWFDRDFTNPSCVDGAGSSGCPCKSDQYEMCNPNWYSNVIGTPFLVSQTCLILDHGGAQLPQTHHDHCTYLPTRSYNTFFRTPKPGYLSGANILDVVKISIDLGLFSFNSSLLSDAYRRAHTEVAVRSDVMADGIRADGSFGQHAGILYNGNYGKDYTNDMLELETIAMDTPYAADADVRNSLSTLFRGDLWMVFKNTMSGVLYWDFSVIGRFISFPVADMQASGGLLMNLTAIGLLGKKWDSPAMRHFSDIANGNNAQDANSGMLSGNRMFYTNDYMVHRSRGYVSTLKMFSSRTKNTECTNLQNPRGFHLSDGALHIYQRGNEYEDIAAAWDWNKIPGTTVDYGATSLTCDRTGFTGIDRFVGGVSTGTTGIAVMRYVNPFTHTLLWQKAWFFLPGDIEQVMVSGVRCKSGKPVYSILDQKRLSGTASIDSVPLTSGTTTLRGVSSLWHDNIGYIFASNNSAKLSVDIGEKTGEWRDIGISTQPPARVTLFAAWLEHDVQPSGSPNSHASISYTTFPGASLSEFQEKRKAFTLQSTVNIQDVSALYDQRNKLAMVVFWENGGGSVKLAVSKDSDLIISATQNVALIYDQSQGVVSVSDPSQSVDSVQVSIALQSKGKEIRKTGFVQFPRDGLAGSTQNFTLTM